MVLEVQDKKTFDGANVSLASRFSAHREWEIDGREVVIPYHGARTLSQLAKDLSVKIQEAGNKLVVIDFYAVWCGPCKIIAPKIEELEKQYLNVVFLKVDVDENEEIAADYDITAMPTFVFIKNGNVLDSFSGANFSKLLSTILQYV